MILPPGTILQLMYLKERLRCVRPGRFIEVGVGQGYVSECLLGMGWVGTGYELDPLSVESARRRNSGAITAGRYEIIVDEWLSSPISADADLVISSMVLEHLRDDQELAYFRRCRESVAPGGRCIVLVPGSPGDWGIEDEIAGHYRRYTFRRLKELAQVAQCEVQHLAGLTYPLSNFILPLSNLLVSRYEGAQRRKTMDERTRASGRRSVPGKTSFPPPFKLLLNEITLFPFYLLQKIFRHAQRALVIYMEFVPRA